MNIAFYAPLKSPHHPVPSGDRLMARQLMAALTLAGHKVTVVSELRSFLPSADSATEARDREAEQEIGRISGLWAASGTPDLWVSYHPYYKAPDLLGPALCRRFDIPYMTAETSYSGRRNVGCWAQAQERVLDGGRLAAANICFTERDRAGLAQAAPDARLVRLAPFIDPQPYLVRSPEPEANHLMTVAMMRPGDKLSSYEALAAALRLILDLPWTLGIVGDGPAREQIERLFAGELANRVVWHGQKDRAEIADLLATAALYLWPGHGEAYGLAYLEAQAAGVPVVAEAVAGVPEAVADGRSGILTPPGDAKAYASAIASLLRDDQTRTRLAAGARRFVTEERAIGIIAGQLNDIVVRACEGQTE
ncbi:glycosyltransferase [Neorhizobium lilium]|uniref:Glycosyltransferase n=1 Tax=Neorhizobium lilium TaxID=2503024 RepID=A0A444LGQ2_9HYPH|nr:glycosyltransferase family 4 protein [Neorhizobium lilium]RWX77352.1 glycosyltransferase [Neorhizobium lilium]